MLPALVTTKVTGPAAMLACDSPTFHSDSFTLTCAATSRCGRDAAPTTAPSKPRATTVPTLTPFDSRSIAAFLVKGYRIESLHGERPARRRFYCRLWRRSDRRMQ